MNDSLTLGIRPKLSGPMPFGWTKHEPLPGMIEEVPEEQQLLLQAFNYIDRGCTVTATARWLSSVCGRRVDQNSLRRFYNAHIQKKESNNADQT